MKLLTKNLHTNGAGSYSAKVGITLPEARLIRTWAETESRRQGKSGKDYDRIKFMLKELSTIIRELSLATHMRVQGRRLAKLNNPPKRSDK